MARILFISDLHLEDSRPAMVALFERFLADQAARADGLYILGDLFESWVGDDSLALPFPARIADALSRISGTTPVTFMRGNRDFLVGPEFARRTGIALVEDPALVTLNGIDAVLAHGDTLCTGDAQYQAFRALVHSPAWQRETLARPLEERLALARDLRSGSEVAKVGKSEAIMDVAPDAVERLFAQSGRSLLIHGHTHRPARHAHRVGGRDCTRWVLGDWYESGSYLEATPGGLRAVGLA